MENVSEDISGFDTFLKSQIITYILMELWENKEECDLMGKAAAL